MNRKLNKSKSFFRHSVPSSFLIALTAFAAYGCSGGDHQPDQSTGPKNEVSQDTREKVVRSDYKLKLANSCGDLREKYLSNFTDFAFEYMLAVSERVKGDTNSNEFSEGDSQTSTSNNEDSQPKGSGSSQGAGSSEGSGSSEPPSPKLPNVGGNEGGVSFTNTNNHDLNADEADVVKTIGEFTFVSRAGKLEILRTWKPSEAKIVKEYSADEFARTYAQIYKDPSKVYNNYSKSYGPMGGEDTGFATSGSGGSKGDSEVPPSGSESEGKEESPKASVEPDENGSQEKAVDPNDKGEFVYISNLALEDNILHVFVSFHSIGFSYSDEEEADNYKTMGEGIRIVSMDITNPASPRIKKIQDFEVEDSDARTVSKGTFNVGTAEFSRKLYNIIERSAHPLEILELFKPLQSEAYEKASDEVKKQMESKVRFKLYQFLSGKITDADVVKALPKQAVYSNGFQSAQTSHLIECSDIYTTGGFGLKSPILVVSKISDDVTSQPKSVGVFSPIDFVYSTKDNLYVSANFYNKFTWWQEDVSTIVHKFSYPSTDSALSYVASGKVDGHLNNQFSMNEHNGYLRLVTTLNRGFDNVDPIAGGDVVETAQGSKGSTKSGALSAESEPEKVEPEETARSQNDLYILKTNGDTLDVVGSIKGLAKGEQVYSARFIGDKGYVVTFRKTDPFFAFDLSDPTKPKLMGELKITGFSSYIHPIDENHLLTIGRQATTSGMSRNLQIQIFDVSDMTQPKQKFALELDSTMFGYSLAGVESHAFTFDKATGILSIPYQGGAYSQTDSGGKEEVDSEDDNDSGSSEGNDGSSDSSGSGHKDPSSEGQGGEGGKEEGGKEEGGKEEGGKEEGGKEEGGQSDGEQDGGGESDGEVDTPSEPEKGGVFKGFFFFKISTTDGISKLGEINHIPYGKCYSAQGSESNSQPGNQEGEGKGSSKAETPSASDKDCEEANIFYWFRNSELMRSIIMTGDPNANFGDSNSAGKAATYIYTITNLGLVIQPVTNLEQVTSVPF